MTEGTWNIEEGLDTQHVSEKVCGQMGFGG